MLILALAWVVQGVSYLTRLLRHRLVYRKAGGAVGGIVVLHRKPTGQAEVFSVNRSIPSLAFQTNQKERPFAGVCKVNPLIPWDPRGGVSWQNLSGGFGGRG